MERQDIHAFEIRKEIEIAAPIEIAFQAVLDELGPEGQMLDGQSLSMKIEPWPGGRWYRDLGNNAGHLWGHVQVIKPPTLLEITGPMPMSYPAVNHVQYRLKEEERPDTSDVCASCDGPHPARASRRNAGRAGRIGSIEFASSGTQESKGGTPMSACCDARAENADMGAKSPRDFCMGPPECHPGVGAQVSRLPGSARDALDRTRPVAFHGNLLALGAAAALRRFIALPDCATSGSHEGSHRDHRGHRELKEIHDSNDGGQM